ncbi:DUF805 domain-containing protein [Bradyrhizobium sp. U87765 SZCCT0131]|uniref:DUF805 domain-containing protein n=1 Tax=unclassified Bradyrhizobium TaxID=2631580 RepID=UPI001BA6E6DA|nr:MULTISPECIES: DUF805 domain-containing protein [unclassified Bradyrhizobium]MBR1221482.1 DUF805 domain-containing protein [Bradyrhizobium sp. U87765 SZCCT0131]MBR1264595.1 DUF805 domain-containing protein [Bradyrhizobium sp. U87765 SZCCT0134]MBR1304499.1 DUF805 domain-containing protein [Bradyrhizobium sp. U87765 SZCCT0110]MBR1322644.1 DUF805 domain-containing protein [Bradyrhizobium sp. U87765 SZCCT0109]MBR1346428.1 DUF805 domain-containing protein [Bradyrhizobium sp. U87765 SZCCT0048]
MGCTRRLFSFRGRINRAEYATVMLACLGWLAFTAWILVLAVRRLSAAGLFPELPDTFHFGVEEIFMLLDAALDHAASPADWVRVMGYLCDLATYRSAPVGELAAIIVYLMGTPILVWIYFVASIKRLHDRERSGWWMALFLLLPAVVSLVSNRLGVYEIRGLFLLAANLFYV